MEENRTNIYRNKGAIISGDRYVHRDIERNVIGNLLDPDNFSSQSVVGMQKIGKSSFAYNCLRNKREELFESERTVVIDITMSTYQDSENFFLAIMKKTNMFLLKQGIDEPVLKELYETVLAEEIKTNGGEVLLEYFNWVVSQMQYKIICVVDEFDKSKDLFLEYPEGFQVLRELTYQPDNRIAFLFLSRRMVEELERFVGYDVSNFANVLTNNFLAVYSDDELKQYYEILASTGVDVSDKVKSGYKRLTGGYPYWMDILSAYYLDEVSEGITLEQVYENHELEFYKLFDGLFALLEDQGLLNTLYQVILGPMGEDATKDKILALCNYGIIEEGKGESYTALSSKFREYMIMKERTIDFYPLWNRAEKLLRKTICFCLAEEYGNGWADLIYTKYTQSQYEQQRQGNKPVAALFQEGKRLIEKMKRNHAMFEISDDENNFVYGGTTSLLAEVIVQEYERCFKSVFLMSLDDFRNSIYSIISVRNPYDHNNDQLIKRASKQEGAAKIKSMITLMEDFFSRCS